MTKTLIEELNAKTRAGKLSWYLLPVAASKRKSVAARFA